MHPEDTADRDEHLRSLRASILGLLHSASRQPALFPEAAPSADDLASTFDGWCEMVRSRYAADLTTEQVDALAAIDRKLRTMSRDGVEFDAELWTEAALTGSEHWAEVRRLSAAALDAFGWTMEAPDLQPLGADRHSPPDG